MSIREGHSRRVSFDAREELGNKIDKLMVMIGTLTVQDSGKARPFKPQIHQNRGRGQNSGYNQRNYQNRYRSDNSLSSRDRGQFRQGRGRHRFEQSYRRNYREIQEIMEEKTAEGSMEVIIIEVVVMIEVGIGLEKGHFPEPMTIIELEVQVIVDQGHDLEPVQTGTEYDVLNVGNTIIL